MLMRDTDPPNVTPVAADRTDRTVPARAEGFTLGHWLSDILVRHLRLAMGHMPGAPPPGNMAFPPTNTAEPLHFNQLNGPLEVGSVGPPHLDGQPWTLFNAAYRAPGIQYRAPGQREQNVDVIYGHMPLATNAAPVNSLLDILLEPPEQLALTLVQLDFLNDLMRKVRNTHAPAIIFTMGLPTDFNNPPDKGALLIVASDMLANFINKRPWFPWRGDYDLACRTLETMASPMVLNLIESLWPSPLNNDASVPRGVQLTLFDMPRTLGARAAVAYAENTGKVPARLYYFRSDPTAGAESSALAIGELVDYYHYTANALANPELGVYDWRAANSPARALQSPALLNRFDMRRWAEASQATAGTRETKLTQLPNVAATDPMRVQTRVNTDVIGERLLPALLSGDAQQNAALVLRRYLAEQGRRATAGLWRPFPIQIIPNDPAHEVDLAVLQAFSHSTMGSLVAYLDASPTFQPGGDAQLLGLLPRDRLLPWLTAESPLSLLALFLDEIRTVYTAAEAGRQVRRAALEATVLNTDRAIQFISARRASEAEQASTHGAGADVRANLLTTLQQTYVPAPPATASPLVTGVVVFNALVVGLLNMARSYVSRKIPGGAEVSTEALTDPLANPSLVDAYTDLMAALDATVDLTHPHTYKANVDHEHVPVVQGIAHRRMVEEVARFNTGHSGYVPGVAGLPYRLLR